MPNEVSSFFGSQFGIQYQSNIQRILRGIVLASASYNAASDNTHHLLIKGFFFRIFCDFSNFFLIFLF